MAVGRGKRRDEDGDRAGIAQEVLGQRTAALLASS
jgi:hypothetical protein